MPLHPLPTKRKDNTEFILGGNNLQFKFQGGKLKFYTFWCGYEWACVYHIVEVERKFQSNSIMYVFLLFITNKYKKKFQKFIVGTELFIHKLLMDSRSLWMKSPPIWQRAHNSIKTRPIHYDRTQFWSIQFKVLYKNHNLNQTANLNQP